MRYHHDVLRERLQFLVDNVDIEQELDERFSNVYPDFDRNVHFAGMTDDDIPEDAPLDSPVLVGPKAPVLYPSIGYVPDDEHDEPSPKSPSAHSVFADDYIEDPFAHTEDHDNVFDEVALFTPVVEDGYGEGWGDSSSNLPIFDGSTAALLDPSTLAPAGELPLYSAPDTPPIFANSQARPVHPGPVSDPDGNNDSVRDVEGDDTQREDGDKKKHWTSSNAATDTRCGNCNGKIFVDKQTLPILLKRPRRVVSGLSLKEMNTCKRRSARIAAMHVADGYKV